MELVQPLFEIVKCMWQPITKRIGYGRRLTQNFTELNAKVTKLCHRRDDINDEIEQVKLQKTPTRECKDWLANVEEIENNMKIFEQEYNNEKRCFKGGSPFCARINLGKRIVETIEQVKELQEKSKFEGGFVTNLPTAAVETVPVPIIKTESAMDRMLQNIMNIINDNRTHRIGIWGMGGVGKTTVMKLVNNTPEITNLFNIVIWVTVSKSWSIRKIQDEIAQRLPSLDIKGDSKDGASRKILRALEGKKFLLLMDDLWEMVDLSSVGLPNTTQENGCKVVLTTREFGVCRKMETDVEIKVEALSEEESWKLFSSKVGELENFKAIEPLAKDIVRKCGGLPLALSVLGRALRKVDDVNVWRNFLRELNSPAAFKDMNDFVFKPLKVSYDHLNDTNHKDCFLYCGLYPEDHNINKSELIDYWTAEKFLSGTRTLAEARDKGHAILQALSDASFLESCEGNDVKLHDVVRDLVLHMTSPDGNEGKFLARAGLSNDVIPEEGWENAKRVSLMYSKSRFLGLPEMPNCPMLTTLLLQNNDSLSVLPQSFFTHMPILRVLDLSDTSIEYLPSSISNLVSLRALLLNYCSKLKELPAEISALKGLEIVRATENLIPSIPIEFWELTNLKCLEFSSRYKGDKDEHMISSMMVPSGSISRLHQLEELSFLEWGSKLLCDESLEVVVRELGSLRGLTSLGFHFREVNNLEHFIENSKSWRDQSLITFCFVVCVESGLARHNLVPHLMKRGLLYGCGGRGENSSSDESTSVVVVPSAIIQVLACSDSFELYRHAKLRKVSDLGLKNMQELKMCYIYECGALETIIEDGDYNHDDDAFPNLEELFLVFLPNLKSIWDGGGPLVRSSGNKSCCCCFTKLTKLELSGSDRLKKLFSVSLAQQLHNLKELSIRWCNELREIIYVDDGNETPHGHGHDRDRHYEETTTTTTTTTTTMLLLPKLETLTLKELPEFFRFSDDQVVGVCSFSLCWPSLKELRVHDCRKLKKLGFRDGGDAANLKNIQGKRDWWEALEWEDESIKLRLYPYFVASKFPF